MKNKYLKGMLTGIALGLSPIILTSALELYIVIKSPIISTRKELEKILQEEKKILNMEHKKVSLSTISIGKVVLAASEKVSDKENEYLVSIPGPPYNLSNLRHELYHISDGHLDSPLMGLLYIHYYEPKTAIYTFKRQLEDNSKSKI